MTTRRGNTIHTYSFLMIDSYVQEGAWCPSRELKLHAKVASGAKEIPGHSLDLVRFALGLRTLSTKTDAKLHCVFIKTRRLVLKIERPGIALSDPPLHMYCIWLTSTTDLLDPIQSAKYSAPCHEVSPVVPCPMMSRFSSNSVTYSPPPRSKVL